MLTVQEIQALLTLLNRVQISGAEAQTMFGLQLKLQQIAQAQIAASQPRPGTAETPPANEPAAG